MFYRTLFFGTKIMRLSTISTYGIIANNLRNQPNISNNKLTIIYRGFFNFPQQFNNNRKEFTNQKIVRFDYPYQLISINNFFNNICRYSKLQLYNVVANVNDYDQFLPNCLESIVISESPNEMVAELVIGLPPLITERYTSIVYLDKPNCVRAKGIKSSILKHLESEWKFEKLSDKKTLITFHVEFEFHSQFHLRLMSMFFDDFTKNTMKAFLDRAYLIYSADPLYFDDKL